MTELQQPLSRWWRQTGDYYDDLWEANRAVLGAQVPEEPSSYLRANVFVGASLLHTTPIEVQRAVEGGYHTNVLWGSDYPHIEGTYRYSEDAEQEPSTWLAMRNAFAGVPLELAAQMVGGNALKVYDFDSEKLLDVTRRINAITPLELAAPLEVVPPEWAYVGGRVG
jgi:hypothetical protein